MGAEENDPIRLEALGDLPREPADDAHRHLGPPVHGSRIERDHDVAGRFLCCRRRAFLRSASRSFMASAKSSFIPWVVGKHADGLPPVLEAPIAPPRLPFRKLL